MIIAAAQTKPVRGDIPRNVLAHRRLVDLAVGNGAEIVVFPELSTTGYEPTAVSAWATDANDPRFDVFQDLSDAHRITIGIGAPTRYRDGVCISLVLFQPATAKTVYSKMHLHPDEEAFFVRGEHSTGLIGVQRNVALAICYELSVPEHAANASKHGADVYIASVAKSVGGVEQALARLSEIARGHSLIVLMANCIGRCDGVVCAGRSSVWNTSGALLSQLDDAHEGILVVDTQTHDVAQHFI